jgi:hypothetical protein
VTQERLAGIESVVHAVHRWGEHKRQFAADQIALAHNVLKAKGWIVEAAMM